VARSLTWRDVPRVFWPHFAFLAAFAGFAGMDALGAPPVLKLALAVAGFGVFPFAAYLHFRETASRRVALASAVGYLTRGALLVGLVVCVLVTVLVVAGGLHDGIYNDEDVVLLVVCWSVLAFAWLASRYIPVFVRRRARDA
jgi:hypothetical protein